MVEPGLVISHLFYQPPTAAARRLAADAELWSLRRCQEPGWLAGSNTRRLFHWGLGPVLADFKKDFVREGLDRYLAENDIELFSFDLGPAARRHLGPLPLSRPLSRAAIYRQTESALKLVRAHYRGPLAAENYNYYPSGLYEGVTEPDFIADYLETFGLGLTLDLAHAAVSAHNLGLDFQAYLKALPLEKTVEIHISRPWLPPGGPKPGAAGCFSGRLLAADHHQAPADREMSWLAELLAHQKIKAGVPVFVEYYGDLSKLEKVQAQLRRVVAPAIK